MDLLTIATKVGFNQWQSLCSLGTILSHYIVASKQYFSMFVFCISPHKYQLETVLHSLIHSLCLAYSNSCSYPPQEVLAHHPTCLGVALPTTPNPLHPFFTETSLLLWQLSQPTHLEPLSLRKQKVKLEHHLQVGIKARRTLYPLQVRL